MPFKGVLKRAVAYTIEVDNTASTAKTAITILKVNKRDRVAAAEPTTVDAGAALVITDTAGNNIDRVIISIHPTQSTTCGIRVVQGASVFNETCPGDVDLCFDAEP